MQPWHGQPCQLAASALDQMLLASSGSQHQEIATGWMYAQYPLMLQVQKSETAYTPDMSQEKLPLPPLLLLCCAGSGTSSGQEKPAARLVDSLAAASSGPTAA